MSELHTSRWTKLIWHFRKQSFQLYQYLDSYYTKCLFHEVAKQKRRKEVANAKEQKSKANKDS